MLVRAFGDLDVFETLAVKNSSNSDVAHAGIAGEYGNGVGDHQLDQGDGKDGHSRGNDDVGGNAFFWMYV